MPYSSKNPFISQANQQCINGIQQKHLEQKSYYARHFYPKNNELQINFQDNINNNFIEKNIDSKRFIESKNTANTKNLKNQSTKIIKNVKSTKNAQAFLLDKQERMLELEKINQAYPFPKVAGSCAVRQHSIKDLRLLAHYHHLEFLQSDVSGSANIREMISKISKDFSFPKFRDAYKKHLFREIQSYFYKNRQSKGLVAVINEISMKTPEDIDNFFKVRDLFDEICEHWAETGKTVRIFYRFKTEIQLDKVIHLRAFL